MTPDEISYHCRINRPNTKLMMVDGKFAGATMGVPRYESSVYWIELIGLTKSFRGLGLGSKMVNYLENVALRAFLQAKGSRIGPNSFVKPNRNTNFKLNSG